MLTMTKAGKAKPTKVELSHDAKAAIASLLPAMQRERDNYQLGVGTVVAELIEKLVNRPDMIDELLSKGQPIEHPANHSPQSAEVPKGESQSRRRKKEAA